MNTLFLALGPWEPEPEFESGQTDFLCGDWDAYVSISARGLRAAAWEDHFPVEADAATVPETERLATAWYHRGGNDFTVVDGVSIGKAYRWMMWSFGVLPAYKFLVALQEALKKTRPRLVVCQDSFPRGHRDLLSGLSERFGFELRIAPGHAPDPGTTALKPLRFSLPAHKRLAGRALNALGRALFGGARAGRPLLISHYHALEPLLERLCAEGSPWRCLATDMPPRKKLWPVLRAGGQLLIDPRTPPDERALPCIQAMRREWMLAQEEPGYLDRFRTREGDSLWPALRPAVESFFRETAPALAWLAARYRELWEREKPAAVLLPFDEPPLQHLLMDLARSQGTPAVTVLHGLPEDYQQLPFPQDASSTLVVWGPEQRRLYEKAGCLKARACEPLGNPAFDRRPRLSARPPGLRRVLALSYPVGWGVALATALDPERYALAIAEATARFEELEVVFKLHPSESLDYYRRILGAVHPRFQIVRDRPINDCLADADLLIGPYTTVLIEAMLIDKPLLCLQFTRASYQPPFDGSWGIETLKSPTELSQFLERLRQDPERGFAELRAPYARILDRFAGPRDGLASWRIMDLLETLSRRGKAPRCC